MSTILKLRRARRSLDEAREELERAESRVEEAESELEQLQCDLRREEMVRRQLAMTGGVMIGWVGLCEALLKPGLWLSGAEIEAVEDCLSGRLVGWEDDSRHYHSRNHFTQFERNQERVLYIARHHGINVKEFALEEEPSPARFESPMLKGLKLEVAHG